MLTFPILFNSLFYNLTGTSSHYWQHLIVWRLNCLQTYYWCHFVSIKLFEDEHTILEDRVKMSLYSQHVEMGQIKHFKTNVFIKKSVTTEFQASFREQLSNADPACNKKPTWLYIYIFFVNFVINIPITSVYQIWLTINMCVLNLQ